jgi:hypothetical protein
LYDIIITEREVMTMSMNYYRVTIKALDGKDFVDTTFAFTPTLAKRNVLQRFNMLYKGGHLAIFVKRLDTHYQK